MEQSAPISLHSKLKSLCFNGCDLTEFTVLTTSLSTWCNSSSICWPQELHDDLFGLQGLSLLSAFQIRCAYQSTELSVINQSITLNISCPVVLPSMGLEPISSLIHPNKQVRSDRRTEHLYVKSFGPGPYLYVYMTCKSGQYLDVGQRPLLDVDIKFNINA